MIRSGGMVMFLLAGVGSAYALPPAGTDLSSPEHTWWECDHQPMDGGKICCNFADGHVLKDDDWKMGADGHYKIRIDTRWFAVPPDRVIQQNVQRGPEPSEEVRPMAKVWYMPDISIESGDFSSITVYCFMPGQRH